jgi:nucleoid-associated protein YgaU
MSRSNGSIPAARRLGWINIRRADAPDLKKDHPDPQDVQALIGDGTPKVSAGGGGWQAVPRDGRVASQWWNGRDAPAVTLPIVLADDPFEDKLTPVKERVNALQTFWGVNLYDYEQPPPLRFDSRGLVPLDFREQSLWLWTLSACDESDGTIRDEAGNVIFATYTITLQRLVNDDVALSEASKRRRAADLRRTELSLNDKVYYVRHGDTLTGIAAKQYGQPDRWREIADHNHLARSNAKHLRPGQRLRLP